MTEKNKDWMPEALSEQEQQLADDQEFLMRQFSALCCPALPEGLSAQNIWEKICAGEGDGQITVDPSTIDVQMEGTEEKETVLESETENPSKEKNNVIAPFRLHSADAAGQSPAPWCWLSDCRQPSGNMDGRR